MIYTVRFLAFIELSGSSSYDSHRLIVAFHGIGAKGCSQFYYRSLFSGPALRPEARKLQHETRERLKNICKASRKIKILLRIMQWN